MGFIEEKASNSCHNNSPAANFFMYLEGYYMSKREDIIKVLKEIKPLIKEDTGPTSIFIAGNAGENYRNLNISDLSVDKDCVTVTTGKYLFKRKYHIRKDEI